MNITAIVSLNNATMPAVSNDAIVEADGKFYIFVVTTKEPEEHHEEEGEGDKHKKEEVNHKEDTKGNTNFGHVTKGEIRIDDDSFGFIDNHIHRKTIPYNGFCNLISTIINYRIW